MIARRWIVARIGALGWTAYVSSHWTQRGALRAAADLNRVARALDDTASMYEVRRA